MSDVATRNAIIRCIQKLITPKLWASGYVDESEDGGYLMVWVPARPKTFKNHTVIDCVNVLGRNWFSNDGYAGGLCTTEFRDAPCHELARVLEWLLTNPERRPARKDTA